MYLTCIILNYYLFKLKIKNMKNLGIVLSFLILFLLSSCQNAEPEESPEASYLKEVIIDSKLHLDHMGQITFMKDYVSLSDYGEKDMISSFDLPLNNQDQADLNIRVFLSNTLTNYLLELAPDRSISDLVHNGNYQFTFIVDDKKVYTENLNFGAGLPYSKNRYTSLCVPLMSSDKIDSWGRFLWARFINRGGGQEALTLGNHNLKIEIRPYVEFEDVVVGDIIAEGKLFLNVIDSSKPISADKIAIQAIQRSEDWGISTEPIQKELIKVLNEKIYKNQFKDMTSIIVTKGNELILEEYFNGSDRETLQDTRSVGKSITSTILGIAIKEGHIKNEDMALKQFYDFNKYDNPSETKATTTLKELLTMTSSFDGSDEKSGSKGSEDAIQMSKNWMDYALNLPTLKSNAPDWTYFTGGTMILGDVINKSVPNGIEEFAQEKLFDPLNIKSSKWFHTPQGLPYGGGGLQLTSLDLAKIGSLYVNDGKWNNQQIIHEDWIKESLSNHVALPKDREGTYGYLWYNSSLRIDGNEIAYSYAAGNGGNVIYLFDDIDLVIVITARAYNTMEGAVQHKKMIEQYILPAVY